MLPPHQCAVFPCSNLSPCAAPKFNRQRLCITTWTSGTCCQVIMACRGDRRKKGLMTCQRYNGAGRDGALQYGLAVDEASHYNILCTGSSQQTRWDIIT